jgi:hypothetical protein
VQFFGGARREREGRRFVPVPLPVETEGSYAAWCQGTIIKTLPSWPKVLSGKRLFFHSEEKERSSCPPCPLVRWWERTAQWTWVPALHLGSRRRSERLCAIRGKHCSPCRNAPWLWLVMFCLRVRAGLSPRVPKTSSPGEDRSEDLLRPRRRRCQGRAPHLSLMRVSVGRYGTSFVRRPRPGAGIRTRHRRWAGWRPILPPSKPIFARRRRTRPRPWPKPRMSMPEQQVCPLC